MNQYKKYMDRQGVSPSLHARLTALAEGGDRKSVVRERV